MVEELKFTANWIQEEASATLLFTEQYFSRFRSVSFVH